MKFLLTAFILVLSAQTANAQQGTFYDQKVQLCNALLEKIESNLSKLTDRDRIRDNNLLLQAQLWGQSYTQHGCDDAKFVNALRRYLK